MIRPSNGFAERRGERMALRIFISHRRRDRELALALRESLDHAVDARIRMSADFVRPTDGQLDLPGWRAALKRADAMLVLYTGDREGWGQQFSEIRTAVGGGGPGLRLTVLYTREAEPLPPLLRHARHLILEYQDDNAVRRFVSHALARELRSRQHRLADRSRVQLRHLALGMVLGGGAALLWRALVSRRPRHTSWDEGAQYSARHAYSDRLWTKRWTWDLERHGGYGQGAQGRDDSLPATRDAAPAPTDAPEEPTWAPAPTVAQPDLVRCSVFAPPSVAKREPFLVQVFVHLPEHADLVRAEATEFDADAKRRAAATLSEAVARGSRLAISLAIPDAEVSDPVQSLVWRGQPESVQFAVTPPESFSGRQMIGTVVIAKDGVPFGHAKFLITVWRTRLHAVSGSPRRCGSLASSLLRLRLLRFAGSKPGSPCRSGASRCAPTCKRSYGPPRPLPRRALGTRPLPPHRHLRRVLPLLVHRSEGVRVGDEGGALRNRAPKG